MRTAGRGRRLGRRPHRPAIPLADHARTGVDVGGERRGGGEGRRRRGSRRRMPDCRCREFFLKKLILGCLV
ncbi:hypothetical protein EE612_029230 [Oryza sativa]|nr:hypothetical protein EE612_029230 [Oryza sativa]